jgi:DNA-binding NarL/FixJ family response regulator
VSAILHALIALEAERDRLDTAITALRALAPVAATADARAMEMLAGHEASEAIMRPPRRTVVAPPRTPDVPKRGRLSNDEKATIARAHRQGVEPEAIAMQLDRPLATVQTAITTMQGEGVL